MAKTHEILGDRWTILIVREMVSGRDTFNDIARGLPGISRSLLTERLRRLEQRGVLSRTDEPTRRNRYVLTEAGKGLKSIVDAFGAWGAEWAFDLPDDGDLDPGLLLWRMQHRLNAEALPSRKIVIQFDFRQGPKSWFWFIIEDDQASVCVSDPGFQVDLTVSADLSAFYQVWLGRRSLASARRSQDVLIEGAPSQEQQFENWFLWSPMAPFVRQSITKLA